MSCAIQAVLKKKRVSLTSHPSLLTSAYYNKTTKYGKNQAAFVLGTPISNFSDSPSL